MADELYLLAIGWIFVRETWNQVPYDWLNALLYSYVYVSISTRITEDSDLVLVLMSRLSALQHKTRYVYVVVRTRLKRGAFLLL